MRLDDPRRLEPAPEPDDDDPRLVWLGVGLGVMLGLAVLAFWAAVSARLMGLG